MSKQYLQMDMLRFTTAGSVDDGKSTLIGRLLYDSKSIFEDQLEAIELSSRNSGEDQVNLALLTDGLRAEREQKITIDVAYRYFATPKRKFIIADTPGHIQYTRNMVTGASTADLAIILVDARKGVLTQSKRHSFISTLLQIPHLVVAVNKMDLVDYSQEVFEQIVRDFRDFAYKMDVDDITFIPISALKGDNIVQKSENMGWYNGPTLLYHLENVHVDAARNLIDFRFPVQYVIRPHHEFRGFAGRISSGIIRRGDQVTVLPSRLSSRIRSISTYEGELEEARAGDSVVLQIEDEIDISRGDMIARSSNVPHFSRSFDAYLCWMSAEAMELNKRYLLMHTSRTIQAVVRKLSYQIDVDSMQRISADRLQLNEIGRVQVDTAMPLFLDTYRRNIATGSFILVDPDTNVTVGAGMVRKAVQVELNGPVVSPVFMEGISLKLSVGREGVEAAGVTGEQETDAAHGTEMTAERQDEGASGRPSQRAVPSGEAGERETDAAHGTEMTDGSQDEGASGRPSQRVFASGEAGERETDAAPGTEMTAGRQDEGASGRPSQQAVPAGEKEGERGSSADKRSITAGEHGSSAGDRSPSTGERRPSTGERGHSAGEPGSSTPGRGVSAGEGDQESSITPGPEARREAASLPEQEASYPSGDARRAGGDDPGAGTLDVTKKERTAGAASPSHEKETEWSRRRYARRSENVVWAPSGVSREVRERRNGHKGMVIWLTGISGAGKSTIANGLELLLWEEGKHTAILDGDMIRHGLTGDLGFSPEDRRENIRRAAHTARAFLEHGNIVICAFVSPYLEDREMAREIVGPNDFFEVHVYCDPDVAMERDPKGLYTKARQGLIKGLTGYDAPYEAPLQPIIKLNTGRISADEAIAALRRKLLL